MPSSLPQSSVLPLLARTSASQQGPFAASATSSCLPKPINARIHPVIAHLAQRFAGWHAEYTGEDVDWGLPGSGDMALLPVALAALLSTGVMDWAAFDPQTGTTWNPFQESYWTFRARCPEARPMVQRSSPARWESLTTFLESFGLVKRV